MAIVGDAVMRVVWVVAVVCVGVWQWPLCVSVLWQSHGTQSKSMISITASEIFGSRDHDS